MAKVEAFEDLVAWQKARSLTGRIYKATGGPTFARDLALRDQMRRAAVSVMSNIAEGFERGSSAEFHRFLFMAKGSCAELRSQLYIAMDAGYLAEDEFNGLLAEAQEVARILGALRAAVERRRQEKP